MPRTAESTQSYVLISSTWPQYSHCALLLIATGAPQFGQWISAHLVRRGRDHVLAADERPLIGHDFSAVLEPETSAPVASSSV